MTHSDVSAGSPVQPCRKLLVLGATSLIGRFLMPRLEESGLEVAALSRTPQPIAGSVRWLQGDLADPNLAARLPQVDAVISLSPIWLLPQALEALTAIGARRLIAFSSTSRLTKIASTVAQERTVAQRLADGEDRTIAACEAAGIDWTIFRPTLIYAEGHDKNVSRLAGLISRVGLLPLSGAGAGLRQPVHADDLALAVLAALDAAQSFNAVYALPGGETLSYRDMAVRVFEGLGRPPRILTVPPALWRLGLRAAAPLLPGATAGMGDRMSADLAFDGAPAAKAFGWSPRAFHPDFRKTGTG
ncbi:MAG: NAD-dependent epimerase/dehydratase family protein [Caulobacteraceae bacterium]